MWFQKQIQLQKRERGFHLVTPEIVRALPEVQSITMGILHLFIQHTSASLTINENADPTVRMDFRSFIDRLVPEDEPYYRHMDEGADDMPAHLKASIVGGPYLSIPIVHGSLGLGTWQGVYLCEHRNFGGARRVVATVHGE